MKQHYGNYLGICVSNTDPECRGRVKVFIPHIMPALYEAWNQEGKDIQIKGVGNNLEGALSPALVETLSKILPWCEAATPILGTCTAGHYNAETHNWAFTSADYKNRAGRGTNCAQGTLNSGQQLVDSSTNSIVGNKLTSILNNTSRDQFAANRGQPSCAGNVSNAIEKTFNITIKRPEVHSAVNYGPSLEAAGFIKVPYTPSTQYPVGAVKISGAGSGHQHGHMEIVSNEAAAQSGNWQWYDKGASTAWNSNSNDISVYIPSEDLYKKANANAQYNTSALTIGTGNADCDQPKTNATAFTDANADAAAAGMPAGKPFNNPGGLPTSKPEEDGAAPEETGTKFPDQTSNSTPAGQAVANGTVDPAFLQQVKSGMGLNDLAAQNAIDAYNAAYTNVINSGYSAEQANVVASALVGNMAQESGFQTNLVHDNGMGYGLLGENQDGLLAETKWLASQGNTTAINALAQTGLTNSGNSLSVSGSQALVAAIRANGGFSARDQVNAIFASPYFNGGNSYGRRSGALPSLLQQSNVASATNSMVGAGTYLVGTEATLNRQNRMNNAIAAAAVFGGMDKTKLAQQAAAARQAAAAGNAAAAARSSSNTIHTTTPIGPSPVDTNGMAAGMFAVPNVGAFLWVFFQEGNPLFPVYFAASFGPAEWASAYKASSPSPYYPNAADGTKHIGQSSIMRPNGAGGIEFNDSYGDAVGDQRKIKLFAHTGAHHMLGPNGTVMYDPHAMYKQTDGHSFDAALGNREFYTQGDANHVTIGDQLVKIGNISQEAYEAAVEHQAILEEAYKLMDQGA